MNHQTLQERQEEIEQESVGLGQVRYRGERPLPWQHDAHGRDCEREDREDRADRRSAQVVLVTEDRHDERVDIPAG